MSSNQKRVAAVLTLAILGVAAGLLLIAPGLQFASGLQSEPHHVVREVEGRSGSVFLHFKAWGLGGGHEAAWASLDPDVAVPDSSRDLLISGVPGGIIHRVSGDTLYLLHDVTVPPNGFIAPLAVESIPLRASDLNAIRANPDSAGVSILR